MTSHFEGVEINGISWLESDSAFRIIENSPISQEIRLNSGELIAVCGPSGSGKSALVHLLAGSDISEAKKVEIKGSISLVSCNGSIRKKRCPRCWYDHIRIVPQIDRFIPTLTCEQLLHIALRLRGKIKTREELSLLLGLMKMNECYSSWPIGKFNKGPDIDYRGNLKKLAILEAISSLPNVLIVDEPAYFTDLHVFSDIVCGLRAYASEQNDSEWECKYCDTHYSGSAGRGNCVIFAFNSMLLSLNPDETLKQFDKFILLSMSRQIVFFGTLKEAIDSLGGGSIWKLLDTLDELSLDKGIRSGGLVSKCSRKSATKSGYHVKLCSQVLILVQRHAYQIKNSPKLILRVIIQRILLFVILSFIFADPNSRASFIGIFFFLPINQTTNVILYTATEGVAPDELKIIEGARFHKMYMTCSLLLSKMFILIPVNILPALVYLPALYFIADFQVSSSFTLFCFANILQIMCTVPVGLFIASSSKDPFVRDLWLFGITTLFVTFGGIHKAANFQITWILRWIQFISPIYYLFAILVQLEYTANEISVDLALGPILLSIGEAFAALAVLGILFTALALASFSYTTAPKRIIF
jgi:ABC-type lipoprotein export system ATPase subunit